MFANNTEDQLAVTAHDQRNDVQRKKIKSPMQQAAKHAAKTQKVARVGTAVTGVKDAKPLEYVVPPMPRPDRVKKRCTRRQGLITSDNLLGLVARVVKRHKDTRQQRQHDDRHLQPRRAGPGKEGPFAAPF